VFGIGISKDCNIGSVFQHVDPALIKDTEIWDAEGISNLLCRKVGPFPAS